ncbi:MAG TPA: hypothetical protein VH351_15320 [Bryobacteraceae bacterium]|nr:hypothetical protein [Bryobacteraceae bacterium]
MKASVIRNGGIFGAGLLESLGIALILASALEFTPTTRAAEPPPNLLKKIALAESAVAKARDNYTYHQDVLIQELDHRDMVKGEYHESRDVTFSPSGSRYEQVVGKPANSLSEIRLTPEDFADIRTIQPFFLTPDNVGLYSGEYKGEETMDGILCFVEHVAPKQVLSGARYFEGLLWVRETDLMIVRSEGQAVPQIDTLKEQNLFPHFTTLWREVDGKWLFPTETIADDTLFFRNWPLRIKIRIRYEKYKKFGVESTLTFEGEAAAPTPPTAPQR